MNRNPIISPESFDALLNDDFYQLVTTEAYRTWKAKLKDRVALRAIRAREARISTGLFGDCKSVGKVSELRVNVGPGYRIYFTVRNRKIILLLLGGDKSSQQADIARAQRMADMDIEEEQ